MSLVRQIPNALTIGRGIAGPVGCHLMLTGFNAGGDPAVAGYGLAALIVLVLAALSDGLDGFLARRLNAESALGELLDPIADKVLVGSFLIGYLVIFDFQILLIIPVAIIIGRDIVVTGLRLMSPKPSALSATSTAKLKTFFQMLLVIAPLVWPLLGIQSEAATQDFVLYWSVAVWFTAGLTIWSALPYWSARSQS